MWQEVYQNARDPLAALGPQAVVNVWKGADLGLMENVTATGLRAMLSGAWYR